MTNVDKGNKLENQVFDWLKPIVAKGRYGTFAQLRQHKRYKTDTGYKILDVTIDLYHSEEDQESDDPYYTVIFECKNHGTTLNARCYDEWVGKLIRLGRFGYKLYIVTRNGVSKDTIESARKNKIGLIRFSDDCKVEYILKRSINDYESYQQSLECLQDETSSIPIIVYDECKFTTIIDILIANGVPIENSMLLHAPFLKDHDIESKVKKLLSQISIQSQNLDILDRILILHPEITVVYSMLQDSNHLGRFDLTTKTIYISESLKDEIPRLRFTLAHELGHYFLHYDILSERINSFGDSEDTLTNNISDEESKWFEIQANKFAAYFLMPEEVIKILALQAFSKYDINRGRLYVDMQKCNQNNYHHVLGEIATKLQVSKSALAYRMIDLGLLEMTKDAKSII